MVLSLETELLSSSTMAGVKGKPPSPLELDKLESSYLGWTFNQQLWLNNYPPCRGNCRKKKKKKRRLKILVKRPKIPCRRSRIPPEGPLRAKFLLNDHYSPLMPKIPCCRPIIPCHWSIAKTK